MKNPELINEMEKIVNRYVKCWKEDFDGDKRAITTKENSLPMIWIVRECGTVLISCPEFQNNDELQGYYEQAQIFINYYAEEERTVKNRFYIIKKGKIIKTTAKECNEQINKNKEEAELYQELNQNKINAA